MRIPRATAVMAAAVLMWASGCTNQITGTATQDPGQPPLALSDDGYGIVAGYPDAPVQIELYTEPQCSHCEELQSSFGNDIEHYINLGELAVTYRPLTFLDTPTTNRHSARVANALFLAVGEPRTTDEADKSSGPARAAPPGALPRTSSRINRPNVAWQRNYATAAGAMRVCDARSTRAGSDASP